MRYVYLKYLRLSSEDIDLDGLEKYESNSIANQRAFLDDFLSKIPGIADCEILEVIDDGRTGTNFQRPGIQKVLELARQGKIHCIVVKDLSRFGRNYLEVGDYLEQIFPAWGTRFISVNDLYDSADYRGMTGGINIAFRNLIAQLYSQDLSEKVRSARDTLNRHGKSSAPYGFYGYVIDPKDRHKLVIDEPAAEVVRTIFNLYEQGMTVVQIARNLNDDGVQTPNERKKEQGAKREWLRRAKVDMWDKSFVTRVLSDERYTGKHIYGKLRRTELGKRNVKAVPPSEWIVVPDIIPPIITPQQYMRVKELREAKTRNKAGRGKSAATLPLFRRKIFCGGCGKALERAKTSKGYVYSCATTKIKAGLGCVSGSVGESMIVSTVLTVIKQQARLAENIKSLKAEDAKASVVTADGLRGEVQKLRRLMEKAHSAKLELWEKQQAGDITREAFQSQSNALTVQANEFTDKIAGLETHIHGLELEAGQENAFVERFSKQVGIEELSREVIDELIKAVIVHAPDRIEILLNYADEYNMIEQTGS